MSLLNRTVLIKCFNQSNVLRTSLLASKRSYIKNYDKKILLEPADVEYRYGDSQFLKGPSYANEPYIKPTDEEMVELTSVKLDKDMKKFTQVDPHSEPFNQVLEGNEDHGRFTQVEPVTDESVWFWVDRLLPKKTVGKLSETATIIQTPKSIPNESYFVERTRTRLFPLYREYRVVDRDHETYWKNRWDGKVNKYHMDVLDRLDEIKFDNNEKTIELTLVKKVRGDIWKFQEDARHFLQQKHNVSIVLVGVNEISGSVYFKGDYVADLHEFLKQKGF